MGFVFSHFGSGYLAMGPTARGKYFAQVCSFAFDQLSSVSGLKVMA